MNIQKLKGFARNIINKKNVIVLLFLCFLLSGLLLFQNMPLRKANLAYENQQLYQIKKGIIPKWGYINKEGKIIIRPQYDEAFEFHEGLAAVRVGDLFGYINKYGEFVIKPAYYGASSFSNGLTAVATDVYLTHHSRTPCEWVYINKGGEVISDKYDDAYSFSEGMALIYEADKGYGYIDISGKLVIDPQFEVAGAFHEQVARVQIKVGEDKKYGYIDKSGNFIIKPKFEEASDFSQGVAATSVKYKMGWGFIDETGEFIIKPESYRMIYEGLSEGMVPATIYDVDTDKYGACVLDKNGKVLFETDYIHIDSYSHGLAAVAIRKTGSKTSGQSFIHTNPDYIWGYIDTEGKLAIKPKYFWAGPFNNEGIAQVEITRPFFGSCIGYIDKNGRYIWKPN